jgi:hypothetical protein
MCWLVWLVHLHEFRLPPRSSSALRSSGLLRSDSGDFLPTFWDNLSGPFQRVKNPRGLFGLVWVMLIGLCLGFWRVGSFDLVRCVVLIALVRVREFIWKPQR